MDIGNKIKLARKEAGLTQEELAKEIGVSRVTINNIEKNKHSLSIDILISISKILNTRFNVC
jgi:putative transcriptional regulator